MKIMKMQHQKQIQLLKTSLIGTIVNTAMKFGPRATKLNTKMSAKSITKRLKNWAKIHTNVFIVKNNIPQGLEPINISHV